MQCVYAFSLNSRMMDLCILCVWHVNVEISCVPESLHSEASVATGQAFSFEGFFKDVKGSFVKTLGRISLYLQFDLDQVHRTADYQLCCATCTACYEPFPIGDLCVFPVKYLYYLKKLFHFLLTQLSPAALPTTHPLDFEMRSRVRPYVPK